MKTISLLILIVSCGTADVKKHKKLKALSTDIPVKIFTEKRPPLFDYEEVCDIIISKQGNSATGKVKEYEEELKEEARKCGSSILFMGQAKKISHNTASTGSTYSYGGAVAIEQTSEELKLTDDKINRLLKAMKNGNVGSMKIILSDLNPDPAERFSYDSRVLESLLAMEGEKGSNCNKKVIQVFKDFHTGLTRVYREGAKEKLHDLLYCESLVHDHFAHFKDRTALVDYVLGKAARASKANLKKIKKVLSRVGEEIQRACQSDPTSEICSMKKRYKKFQ